MFIEVFREGESGGGKTLVARLVVYARCRHNGAEHG